jgi:hypothetical protein
MAETWLRVVTYASARPQDPEALAHVAGAVERVYALLERHTGFRVGHWGYDPESGAIAAITQWADRAAIAKAAADLAELHRTRHAHGLVLQSQTNLRIIPTPWAPDAEDWAALTVGTNARGLRVVTYRTDPAAGTAPMDHLRESTPATAAILRRQRGFRLGYWAHAPSDGALAAVTFWDDRDAISRSSMRLAALQRDRSRHGLVPDRVLNLQLFGNEPRPPWQRELRRLELLMAGPSA